MGFLEILGVAFALYVIAVTCFAVHAWITRPPKIVSVPSGKSDVEKALGRLRSSAHHISDQMQRETVEEVFRAVRGYCDEGFKHERDWVDEMFIQHIHDIKKTLHRRLRTKT